MTAGIFTTEDLTQIKAHGLTPAKAAEQINRLKAPPPRLKLLRPCTPGDGILTISAAAARSFVDIFDEEAGKGRCLEFSPASGAATRMFKAQIAYLQAHKDTRLEGLEKHVRQGDLQAREVLIFLQNLPDFAFLEDLRSATAQKTIHFDTLLKTGQFSEVLRFILNKEGLNCADLPKGLLKFHRYADRNRTPLEEHLVEAAHYIASSDRRCKLHFTVSPQHRLAFADLFAEVKPFYEEKCMLSYDVAFSEQKPSTDTLAVDLRNRPFRKTDGRLLFRPGGHGALLENLNELRGDIVFLKNIDNVVPDRLKGTPVRWKKILGGYLLDLQKRISGYLRELTASGGKQALLDEIAAYASTELGLPVAEDLKTLEPEKRKTALAGILNRPIRVCGMVENRGEAGGGPFWVQGARGEATRQIVESVQIDSNSAAQKKIVAAATHFNPVDLVCGVSDWQGRPFDLRRYVDPASYFIARKSRRGRDLKALEHPGLWNGGMAHWITLFVDVPPETFNPVKTVNDLLRDVHYSDL